MTDQEKETLLKHSNILKENAIELCKGKGSNHVVFALMHAASQIIKESGEHYRESVAWAATVLFHLDDCPGCEDHVIPMEKIN